MNDSNHAWLRAAVIAAAVFLTAPNAHAIIEGGPSGLAPHLVKVQSTGACTGVVIGRRAVVTAGHCAPRAVVIADGQRIPVARVARSAEIEGRRVSVAGDAAILILREPLPPGFTPVAIGAPTDGPFTIAGFGTADEAHRLAVGTLREARVVAAGRYQLVDPNRTDKIGASACYGDSGGAVLQNGMLVGVITRASFPRAKIACGFYTQYAPVIASGPTVPAAIEVAAAETLPVTLTSTQKHVVKKWKKKRKKWKRKRRR